MKFRFFSPALFIFILVSLNLNAQPGIVIDSVAGQTGQIVCVPVRAKGFDVNSMWGSISWDPQVLDIQNVQTHDSLLYMTSANFTYPQPGKILFSWFDPAAFCVSVDDGEILFEICFSVIGPAGSNSDISIDTAEIINCYGQDIWSYVESQPALFWVTTATNVPEPGSSNQITFTISPNPASSGAQVIFHSQKDGTALFFVTNMLEQTVFAQKVSIAAGENQIQIPTEALKTEGAYRVSLQTERGINSRILVVK